MYMPEFWKGVLVTVLFEILANIVFLIYMGKEKK